MNRKVSVIVLIGIIFIIVLGCEIVSKPFVTGSFTLSINMDGSGRTILPDVANSIVSYLIEFDGPTPMPPVLTTGSSVLIDLTEGFWDITVSGMSAEDGTGDAVAIGTVSVSITTGLTTTASVYLSPLTVGTGNVDVIISWPESEGIDGTSTILFNSIVYTMGDSEITFNGTERTISFNIENINSGNYYFFAYLKQSGTTQATVTESIQVFDNLTSSALIVLYTEDFNQPPGVSTLLTPVEGNNEITLTWENSSSVITGFSLERSESEFSGYSEIVTTDGVTSTYTDTTVVVGTTYYYRVIASSAGGASDPSNVVSLSAEPPLPGNGGLLTFSDTTSNSTILSWTQAVDNVSVQSYLEYKIVQSELNNIDTVENAETNGTLVQDWVSNTANVSVTELTSKITYYFNVLVRDLAGNINIYTTNSETPSTNGVLNLTLSVTEPNDETITFSAGDDITVSQSGTLAIEVSESFDSYEWYLDGVEVIGQTDSTFELVCSDASLVVHHLSVFVTSNSMLYSNTVRFIVTN